MNISATHNSNISNTFNVSRETKTSDKSFIEVLNQLNDSQVNVSIEQEKFINGEIEAHQLMATVAESELTLKLASSIASKLITGVQELTNMQI